MRNHANWTIVESSPTKLVLKDIGHNVGMSMTNDIEYVVEEVADMLHNRRLFYYDSCGDLSEIYVSDGQFSGWGPI